MHLFNKKQLCTAIIMFFMAIGFQATAQISFSLPAHKTTSPVTAIEYYFDTDPGFGNGTALPLTSGNQANINPAVGISHLTKGVHRVFVRARNDAGQWGVTSSQIFVTYALPPALLAHTAIADIVKAEYFIDTDPGLGSGTDIPITAGNTVNLNNIAVNITGFPLGVHYVFFRTKNTLGSWSTAANSKFTLYVNNLGTLPAHAAAKPITSLEYYFDTDPGTGNGIRLNVPASTDLANYIFAADISALTAGTHTLFVRSLNGTSATQATTFDVGTKNPLPVNWISFQAQQQRDSVLLAWRTANENNNSHYIIEHSTDGRDFKTIGRTDAKQNDAAEYSYGFTDKTPMTGLNFYRLKQTDLNGVHTYSVTISVNIIGSTNTLTVNNPVHSTLMIHRMGEVAGVLPVAILNASGVVVKQSVLISSQETIDMSNLPSGFYFLRWHDKSEQRMIRFIKQ